MLSPQAGGAEKSRRPIDGSWCQVLSWIHSMRRNQQQPDIVSCNKVAGGESGVVLLKPRELKAGTGQKKKKKSNIKNAKTR